MAAVDAAVAGSLLPARYARVSHRRSVGIWLPLVSLMYCLLLAWPEYEANPSFAPVRSGIHRPLVANFTPIEFAVLGFIFLSLVAGGAVPAIYARLPKVWFFFLVATVTVVIGAVWVGMGHGSHAPFGDWKNLGLGLGFWFALTRQASATVRSRQALVAAFLSITTLWASWLLADYVRGRGPVVPVLGHIPLWDRPSLEYMVAAAILASWRLQTARPHARLVVALLAAVILPTVVVILSFRRFAWVELGAGLAISSIVAAWRARRVARSATWLAALVSCVAVGLSLASAGQKYDQRLGSIFTSGVDAKGTTYAGTNQSHLNDIRDGWDIVRRHPFFGLGVGATYQAQRTAAWKAVSGMVHNGPIDVWIKFGAAGLTLYGFAIIALLRKTAARIRRDPLAGGVFAFFIGEFIISNTVFPWPVDTLAGSLLIFTLIAVIHPSIGGEL